MSLFSSPTRVFIICLALTLNYNYAGVLGCNEDELGKQCTFLGDDYYPNCDLETCDECTRVRNL